MHGRRAPSLSNGDLIHDAERVEHCASLPPVPVRPIVARKLLQSRAHRDSRQANRHQGMLEDEYIVAASRIEQAMNATR
jgi:hypothetical protein